MLFVNLPIKIINILEGNISPREIAAGVCLGLFLGFIPLNAPMALLLAIFFFTFKINRVATLITLPVFKSVYILGAYKLTDSIGLAALEAPYLTGFWRAVTHMPVLAYLDINNTLVAGGLVISMVLSIPAYFIAKKSSVFLISKYSRLMQKIKLAGFASEDLGAKSRKKSLFKRLNVAGIVIVVGLVMAIHFAAGFFVSPVLGSLIVNKINKYSRVRISVDRVNVWPLTLSFSMKGLKVFDPESQTARIAKIDNCAVRISPFGLLSRRLVVSQINISGAEINVEGYPDGSFNISRLVASKKSGEDFQWRSLIEKKDLFGKIYEIVKKRFSKKSQQQVKEEKVTKTVQQLPKGRMVHFRNAKDFYLFEIKKIDIADAYVAVSSEGNILEITKARARLGGIAFDPESGINPGLVDLRGNINRGSVSAGKFNIFFSQGVDKTGRKAIFNAQLDDIDMDATRFIYKDSLPVHVIRGLLTLKTKTYIEAGAINSHNEIYLKNHILQHKAGEELMIGFVPVTVVCNAVNRIDPLKLSFDITGPLEKPEFKGFQEILMTLIKPHITDFKESLKNEGVKTLISIFENIKERNQQ